MAISSGEKTSLFSGKKYWRKMRFGAASSNIDLGGAADAGSRVFYCGRAGVFAANFNGFEKTFPSIRSRGSARRLLQSLIKREMIEIQSAVSATLAERAAARGNQKTL